ncbi:tetratricopeptide repeat protein [Runella sp.]|uniref:tetratricopeptide repeat protein n=1 Tax=Runella sp. TaxID=1960881 RepID=UPI003D0F2C1C
MHLAYRYPLFLLVGFLISFASSSQTPKIDSLKKVLASLPPEGRSYRNDTIRMLVLCELGKESIGKKITPCIEQAILEANTIGWPKGIMVAYFHHGRHYGALGSYYRASQSLFKALSVSERLQDVQMSSKILLNLGNFYQVMGNAVKGLEFHLKALNYARNIPDIKLKLLNLIGTDYVRLSNYSKAEYYLLKGRKLAKLYGNKTYQVVSLYLCLP